MTYNPKTIIVEIAGRDSYVSLLKHALQNPDSFYLPTITSIPTEEQRYSDFLSLFQTLSVHIAKLGSHLYAPIITQTQTWKRSFALSVFNQSDYGFSSPCLLCHSIVHGIRANLSLSLSGQILTGEKEWHGEFIKLNQNKQVFDIFDNFFNLIGISFIRFDLTPLDMLLFNNFLQEYNLDHPKFITCSVINKIKVSSYDELKQYKIHEYFNNEVAPILGQLIGEKKEVWNEL